MASPIVVTNLRDHEVVPHGLVVFDGYVADFAALGMPPTDWFLDARLDVARGAFWPVTASGRFKALVLLPTPGKYAITLRIGPHERVVPIEYEPPVTRYVVRFYYQKCHDAGDYEGFDAPPGVDNSDQAAIQKIRFNALLLQTATAEMFVHAGLPRKTFAIDLAEDGLPYVRLLRSTFHNETARSIHDQELIKLVEQDIVAFGFDEHDELEFKHAVILGCSKYNPETQHSDGHTALGGGKVGIFGSCGLHTWPRHLGEVTSCSLNNARIDTGLLMDDSAYRGTFWANFSTGIGAFIHELGHTFGLGHATSGIMSRGFDDMTRLFCAYEPDHKRHEPGYFQDFYDGRLLLNHQVLREVTGPDGAHWNHSSAHQLVHCPWISGRPKESTCGPLVCWNGTVRGPVGEGNTQGETKSFEPKHRHGDLGAVRIKTGHYLEKIKSYSREEIAELSDKKLRARKRTQWVMLAPDEFVTRVEVRAGAWIDGLRIHTNFRATRWYGGSGGSLHELRPDDGSKINGFFGTRGDDYVGRLGVLCAPITETPSAPFVGSLGVPSNVHTSHTVGGGLSGGPHESFSFCETQMGAIVVRCDDFVNSIRVESQDAHLRATQDTTGAALYDADELVFALRPGEFLVRVSVRCGHWIDAVRFHTNLRSSPWFGGKGGGLVDDLACEYGHRICGLHGRRGDEFVDMLGVYTCENVASSTRIEKVGPIGYAEQDGEQRRFGVEDASLFEEDVGAVLIEADDSVSSIRTVSRRELAAMRPEDTGGAIWFTLEFDEYITHAEVRAMCWVDAVRLHTNLRSSPWFGGSGGELQSLRPSDGFKIQRFFGSTGDCHVGCVGAYCVPITSGGGAPLAAPPPSCFDDRNAVAPPPFSLLSMAPPEGCVTSPHYEVARGVLLAVQHGVVMYVSSFDSLEAKFRLGQELEGFAAAGAQLHSFNFQPGEFLVQIDASVGAHDHHHHDHHHRAIEGLCFHTTSRCSSWFGAYSDSSLVFLEAAPGCVIRSVCGVPGGSGLRDVVGEFLPRRALAVDPSRDRELFSSRVQGNILEDDGAFDVRVVAQSPAGGLVSVHLLKVREGENLDQHAWTWRGSPAARPPHKWCLPQRMLEHHVTAAAAESGRSPREALFTEYSLGAMDVGGAFSMAACPPV